ncbi:PIG-L family deacetylase [Lentisphaera profundi]|uniref:PIG-L family deacetylase n=1 Tax=Lentisphaera profundi TaxID=1658616 RepID=A0ABY7VNS9_9BACT|nr:PIG-L family deacetylase [Lentisphaera profundi]WDE95790.1 PIG-L family deacetylase [Lentisphaera profundi]
MEFIQAKASSYIPSGKDFDSALASTTHLAIVAHQDDTEILAYNGIAECFGKKDLNFSSVILSNGSGSPRTGNYAAFSDEEMQAIRRDEQNKAASLGNFSAQIQLAYPSSEIKDAANKNTVCELRKILETAQPEVVYLHNPADKHDTHVATMLRAIEAIRSLPKEQRPKKVYGCEVWRDLDWMMDDEKVVLPTDQYPHIAQALIAVFDSQVSGGKRYDLATVGRRVANATYFASHAVDSCDSMNFGMDLSPLIEDEDLSISEYVGAAIQRFQNDVANKLDAMS